MKKLNFNIHSKADWLALAGVLVLVIQYVAQLFGFKWGDTAQLMNGVNTIIMLFTSYGLVRDTTPTETDNEIAEAVKQSENKGDTSSAKTN